ncbi:hypothetical protein SDC9_145545 [bioreactor metagenome]|uniref:HTH cro/C1-type domain-containing protein n=1 Tax=bioreactor metagenome TaxID=1076179 RepID=A0A645EAE7_9ZZZZ|nr:helix-turn-helix transcriptional regulator [Candidatus Pelethousia sp.]
MWLDELRAMKEASGLTTRDISIAAKIPEPTLEKIFSGATKDPKLTTIQQLVHFLGYTLDDLTPNHKEKAPAGPLELEKEETQLIIDYRLSSPEDQAALRRLAGYAARATLTFSSGGSTDRGSTRRYGLRLEDSQAIAEK